MEEKKLKRRWHFVKLLPFKLLFSQTFANFLFLFLFLLLPLFDISSVWLKQPGSSQFTVSSDTNFYIFSNILSVILFSEASSITKWASAVLWSYNAAAGLSIYSNWLQNQQIFALIIKWEWDLCSVVPVVIKTTENTIKYISQCCSWYDIKLVSWTSKIAVAYCGPLIRTTT